MNFNQVLKSAWPHVVIVILFIVLSFIYFLPVVQGKILPQNDNMQAKGAAQEVVAHQEATGEISGWTDSMFGGMPTYQIKGDNGSNIFGKFNAISRLSLPYTTVAILFLYMLGFYLLMLSLKLNKWIAVIGALAFAFGSYNIIIIIAGHITKAYAIALMPVVLAGVIMIFNSKYLVGGLITAIALGMEIAYNHVQITYYLALMLLVLVVERFIYSIRNKKIKDFGKQIATLCVASLLSILPGTANLWTTYEYGNYSTRGVSELTQTKTINKTDSGLDKDYALSWSYGIKETPTLLIPNIVGGASEAMGYDLKSVQKISDKNLQDAIAQQSSKYWGGRGFTSGPVYVGSIICFLFFLGCFYYKGREKWWLIAATIFSILLAWGKNFLPLTDFMFYHFPMYNKFRTVEMALVIATVTIPTLGFLGLKELYENPERIKYEMSKFFGALGLTAGFALLIYVAPTLFYSYLTAEEASQFAALKSQNTVYGMFEQGIIDARIELARTDAIRSVVFIILASSALWFYSVRKISLRYAMITLSVLILIDMWSVDKRYLSEKDFVQKTAHNEFPMTVADKAILSDNEPHRVASLIKSTFNDATTSYYHQSIGGYHGAKLRRYQDIIDNYLGAELQTFIGALQSQDYEKIEQTLRTSTMLNALNTKYFIYNPEQNPLVNPYANGAAWFVDDVKTASSADDAITMLRQYDLKTTAILEGCNAVSNSDSMSIIKRTQYLPNKLTYESNSNVDRVAVFSEIYYPIGWKAYIDGAEAPIMQADYILRALSIPAGKHEIVFEFVSESHHKGVIVSTIASSLIIILIIVAIIVEVRKRREKE